MELPMEVATGVTVRQIADPETIIMEILKRVKNKDIHIESITQNGTEWQATGDIAKFNGKVKLHFCFSFGK